MNAKTVLSGMAGMVSAMALWIGGCAIFAIPTAAGAASEKPRITVLYDAFGRNEQMRQDWGYAALVEVGGKRILFDTGNDGDVLARNAKAKGIDLSKLDFVVMSHRHGDHIGGLSYLLGINPKVKIYAPKEGFGVFGADLPGSFYRQDPTLPIEQRYYGGNPPEVMRFASAWPEADITLIDKTTEIAPGIHLIALVSDKPGTLELRELSLAIDTPDGIVLMVACSHPGIDKIVQAAAAIDPRILFVAGGFHLLVAKDPEIAAIVGMLRDTYKVGYVAPGHCTGEPTFTALKTAFGERYLYAGLGSSFEIGAAPRALAEAGPAAMDGRDIISYRMLLGARDDDGHPAQRPGTPNLRWPLASPLGSDRFAKADQAAGQAAD
jgi:7,8-dihydropterin-6-yl-methyl-4-(beta-D-ribofuranosyl)aminobenzene 5'-phosphate synthase